MPPGTGRILLQSRIDHYDGALRPGPLLNIGPDPIPIAGQREVGVVTGDIERLLAIVSGDVQQESGFAYLRAGRSPRNALPERAAGRAPPNQ